MDNPMATLTRCGILEHGRRRAHQPRSLRVSPRFLAHAETTSAHLAQMGRHLGVTHALEVALASWDGAPQAVRPAAAFLNEFLGEREQYGGLRPVFPSLEQFSAAA